MTEINNGSGAENQAPSLDQIDAEMAAAEAVYEPLPPPPPRKGARVMQTIRPRFGGYQLVKVTRLRPVFLLVFKLPPNRARRRAPRRHAVQRAGAESGDSDGGGDASSSDAGLPPSRVANEYAALCGGVQ